MSKSEKVELKTAIAVAGEAIKELMVRSPTVRDRLIADKTPGSVADKELSFISNLCGVAPDVIMQLELADYIQLQKVVNDFLS